MSKEKKLILFGVIGFIVAIVIFAIFVIVYNHKNSFDHSKFKNVTINEVLDYFDDDKMHFVFIGNEDCNVCEDVVKSMEKGQEKYNFKTSYLDIEYVNMLSDDWTSLVSKLDKKQETVINHKTGKTKTDTFGNLLNDYRITPTVIAIKDGKQIGGFIGAYDEETIMGWINHIYTL